MVCKAPEVGALGPPLTESFFLRPTVEVARDLIGRLLVACNEEGEPLIGRIVETEAYGPDDPASHAYRGPRRTNAAMFGRPGLLYVYRSHGIHFCANVVTQPEGVGEAVLLRALQPLAGLESMRERRGPVPETRLCAGPGCLCRAFGIGMEHNGADLQSGPLRLFAGDGVPLEVAATPRIGISRAVERPWRFVARGSPYLSRPWRQGEKNVS